MYHLLMRVGGYYTPIRNKFVQVQIHVNFLCDLLILCIYMGDGSLMYTASLTGLEAKQFLNFFCVKKLNP